MTHIATAGDICLINPGEVHTSFSPHESGWTYRVFYTGVPLLEKAAEAVLRKKGRARHFSSPVIRDKTLSRNLLQFLKSLESSDLSMEKESLLLSPLHRWWRGMPT